MKWYVYIVECEDDSLYTGITNDITRRLAAHKDKKGAKYTKGRTPRKLVYTEEFENKGQALKREFAIKKLPRAKKLELIN
ncbi:MAG: GIY-YIG nuclease family protein [bacterium]|nr:GIY-YIG nuclease family protein [bacterium]